MWIDLFGEGFQAALSSFLCQAIVSSTSQLSAFLAVILFMNQRLKKKGANGMNKCGSKRTNDRLTDLMYATGWISKTAQKEANCGGDTPLQVQVYSIVCFRQSIGVMMPSEHSA